MDEPQKMGGTDTGATPLHTLLASLAGCEHGNSTTLSSSTCVILDLVNGQLTIACLSNCDAPGPPNEDQA